MLPIDSSVVCFVMKLIYFKSLQKNFGDDLNAWLWPQLFPPIPEGGDDDGNFLIGIGSILDSRYQDLEGEKLVLGAGARPQGERLILDNSWKVSFVRGPLSAEYLDLPSSYGAGDGAFALSMVNLPDRDEKFVSVIPHYRSMNKLDWSRIADYAGVHLIDPRDPVEVVLRSISNSKLVIAEAMHGAIVADLMRVPWLRITAHSMNHEGKEVAEFKWADWMRSLNISAEAYQVADIPKVESSSARRFKRFTRVTSLWQKANRLAAERRIGRKLRQLVASGKFILSGEGDLRCAIDMVKDRVQENACKYSLR